MEIIKLYKINVPTRDYGSIGKMNMKSLCQVRGCEHRSIKGGLLTNLRTCFDKRSFSFVGGALCSIRGVLVAVAGLLSVGGLSFGPAHPWYRRSLPFPAGGGCFDRCSFWSHEYSKWASGIAWRWRKLKWKTDGFRFCARMKKNGVEDRGAEGYKLGLNIGRPS